MKAGRKLRQVIMDRIIAEVPELGGRVYDSASEGDLTPYATMGPSYWVDQSVECVKNRAQTIQIDVWHVDSNKGVVEDIMDDIETALDGWADTVALTMAPARVTLVRVMDDPDGVHVHGVAQVEARVEG